MAGLGQLSPEDLAGATVVSTPPAATSPPPAAAPALGRLSDEEVASADSPPPSILESLGRGALQGATFGFADEIAGALESAFTKKTYKQARDESRAAFNAAAAENPKANLVGEIGGSLAGALVPGAVAGKVGGLLGFGAKAAEGAEAAATAAEAAPSLGRLAAKGALTGAGYGALQGLGESTADLTEPGNFHQAIKDTLTGAAIGGAAGAVLEPAATKLLEGSPERVTKDIIQEITAGEGKEGSATVTAKKLVAKDKEDILATVQGDKELAKAVGKPAKEALPVVDRKMNEVGSKLDPNYDVVDTATGGVKLSDMVKFLDEEAAKLAKTPLNEQYVHAVTDIRDSALKAWAPKLAAALKTEEAQTVPAVKDAVLKEFDQSVPTRDVRAMVTRLQTRGSQVINPLNPGEASVMKADMASMMKEFIDKHLDEAAKASTEVKTAVDNIRQINTTYSALANIRKAIEQRGWKEATGSTSLGGHGANLLTGAGLLAAAPMALHGNLPGAIATALMGKFAPGAARTVTHEGNRILAQIVTDAAAGKPVAQLAKLAIEKGVPRAAVMQAVRSVSEALGGASQSS